MRNQPDPNLTEAAMLSDTQAIDELIVQCHPVVTNFARQYCPTSQDVEDAVQETLWIASQKIHTLRINAALISWLFQVVRRQCLRLLQRWQKQDVAVVETKLDRVDFDPELRNAMKADVAEAIANLSPEQRQVLIMRDVQDMTAPMVAEALGITIATVKSRLHYARNMLRQSLSQWR